MNADFTADVKSNVTLRAFVQASGDLLDISQRAEDDISGACRRIGRDLGVPNEQMAPLSGDGGKAKGACARVSAKVDSILKGGGGAQVRAKFTPPKCETDANLQTQCTGLCDAKVDPGYLVAHCDPGKLSGTCEGSCQGACDGTCHGACDGTCSTRDSSGQCDGHCQGKCEGRCDATCHAKCSGEWKAPKCASEVKLPNDEAKCTASGRAHGSLRAQCSEPKVDVTASAKTGSMAKVIATLEANLPALLKAEAAYGSRIAGDVQALVSIGEELPNAVGHAGAKAAACVAASASAAVHAQASLRVSIQASASVSGKAGARTG